MSLFGQARNLLGATSDQELANKVLAAKMASSHITPTLPGLVKSAAQTAPTLIKGTSPIVQQATTYANPIAQSPLFGQNSDNR